MANEEGNASGTGSQPGHQDAPRTFTQDEVNAIISQRLRDEETRITRRLSEQYGDLGTLAEKARKADELEAASLSETDRLRKELEAERSKTAEQVQKAQEAQLQALRLEVGAELGLTPTLAARLTGTDKEALKADATAILAELKITPRPPRLDATAGTGDSGGPAVSDLGRDIAQRLGIPLDKMAEGLKAAKKR